MQRRKPRPSHRSDSSSRLRRLIRGFRRSPAALPAPAKWGEALAVRPQVQPLEDRTFPGQAPGVLGWALAGTGLALLDQSLLAFPLDAGEASPPPWLPGARCPRRPRPRPCRWPRPPPLRSPPRGS